MEQDSEPGEQRFLKFIFSHLRSFVLYRASNLSPFPSSLLFPPVSKPKAHHFSFPRMLSQSAAGIKMESGARGTGELERGLRLGFAPRPPLSPAPTWAYPCCLLFLLIVATSEPPRHCDQQTCRGPG